MLAAWLGVDSIYVQEGEFFSTAAVVTFGGAYAVLAYIAQHAVHTYGWLAPRRDARRPRHGRNHPSPAHPGRAVRRFMGAYRAADGHDPLLAGVAGAVFVWSILTTLGASAAAGAAVHLLGLTPQ